MNGRRSLRTEPAQSITLRRPDVALPHAGARAIPPWLHRVVLRDFGPRDPLVKLVVFTVNSFMDESGGCFPSQEAIAKASGLGISTVRRKIAVANRSAWLSISAREVYSGRHWRQYRYRCCCPASIDLKAVPVKKGGTAEDLANHFEADHGAIDPETLCGTHFPQVGKRRVPPRVNGTQAPPGASGTDKRKPASVGASGRVPLDHDASTARSGDEHRPLTTRVPPAAEYEVPSISFKQKEQEGGRRASAPTGRFVETVSKIPKPDSTKAERICKAIASMPGAPDDDIRRCVSGATIEEVRRARSAAV